MSKTNRCMAPSRSIGSVQIAFRLAKSVSLNESHSHLHFVYHKCQGCAGKSRIRKVPQAAEPTGRATKSQVLIAGAGPVGLTLAIDLAWRGIDVAVVEIRYRGEPPRPGSHPHSRLLRS
jgi:NADPH-dependent 2,4-dienoyl-CoA reductase/sulfur reductase-like enzyme